MLRCFDGGVNSGERDIAKPGACLRFDPLSGFPGDEVGDVAAFFDEFAIVVPGDAEWPRFVAVVIRVNAACEAAISGIETKLVGAVFGGGSQMPFSKEAGFVARIAEGCGECFIAVGEDRGVGGDSGVASKATGMASREQTCARGSTHGADVVLVEFDARGCEAVDIGRANV